VPGVIDVIAVIGIVGVNQDAVVTSAAGTGSPNQALGSVGRLPGRSVRRAATRSWIFQTRIAPGALSTGFLAVMGGSRRQQQRQAMLGEAALPAEC
jgi:hypothetical protein